MLFNTIFSWPYFSGSLDTNGTWNKRGTALYFIYYFKDSVENNTLLFQFGIGF